MGAGEREPGGGDGGQTWTVLAALTWTVRRFEAARLATPRLDAELLLAHATGLDRVGLYVSFDKPLSPAERGRFREHVRRRLGGEPVAYLRGRQAFYSIELGVDGRVLIPRRETEHVVEQALAQLAGVAAPRVADVATGSGAIALAIKHERPEASVTGVDLSEPALEVARENARRLGLDVTFGQGDLLGPLAALPPFDVVAANPPYIASAALADLQREVQCEPRLALEGGPLGLSVLERLVRCAPTVLVPGGALITEMGADQGAAVLEMAQQTSAYDEARVVKDLAGLDRVLVARKKSP